ncbi:hypothetical protein C0995_002961 [Termitomyces sp. Mi166|nr:hypothetical protein C0995_002961 [Termitomyces sp. Mi166\
MVARSQTWFRRSAWFSVAQAEHFRGPIDLGVMLSEPREPKDHVLPSQAGDGKYGALHMAPIAEDQVNHRANCASFVGRPVDVVDWNGLGKGLRGQAMASDELRVQEESRCSTIQESCDSAALLSVRHLNLHIEAQGAGR